MNILNKLGYLKKVYILTVAGLAPVIGVMFFFNMIPEWLLVVCVCYILLFIPFFIIYLRKIKCQNCNEKILWNFLNQFPMW